MDTPEFASFEEFFPFYLGEHSDPLNRTLHYIGTASAIVTPPSTSMNMGVSGQTPTGAPDRTTRLIITIVTILIRKALLTELKAGCDQAHRVVLSAYAKGSDCDCYA